MCWIKCYFVMHKLTRNVYKLPCTNVAVNEVYRFLNTALSGISSHSECHERIKLLDSCRRGKDISLITSVCKRTPAVRMSAVLLLNGIFKKHVLSFHFWRRAEFKTRLKLTLSLVLQLSVEQSQESKCS